MREKGESMLQRIATALRKGGTDTPSGESAPRYTALQWESVDDLRASFTRFLEIAGGEVVFVRSRREFDDWTRNILNARNIVRGVYSTHQHIESIGIVQIFRNAGIELLHAEETAPEQFRVFAESAQLGIGTAQAGFADCGAILVASSKQEPRTLSLLPEMHIALLREEDLYPSMSDYTGELHRYLSEAQSSAFTLIGGPSKTADIEKTLVQGVHGPRSFLVAILA